MKIRSSNAHKCTKCLLKSITQECEDKRSAQAWLGTIIHAGAIDDIAKNEGFTISNKEKAYENALFTGHIDGQIDDDTLFELKTVSTWIYNSITAPKWEHISQIHVYSILGGFKRAKMCYLNRDSGEYKLFDIPLDTKEASKIKHALKKHAVQIYRYAKSGMKADDIKNEPFETCDIYCEYSAFNENLALKKGEPVSIDEVLNQDEIKDLINSYKKAKILEDEAKADKEAYANKIKESLSSQNITQIKGVATFYKNERTSFDKDSLKIKYPNIYDEFCKTNESTYFKIY